MCLLWKRRCCDLIGAFHNALDWREQEMIEYPTNSLMSFTSAAMTQAPSFKLEYPTNSLMSFTSAAMTQAPSFKLVTPPPRICFCQ